MTKAVLNVPKSARRGDVIEVRALIGHPMETGLRVDHEGKKVPRDLITRLEARFAGRVVFAATLHPSVSAHPFVTFHLRVDEPGLLEVGWTGDHGFSHVESVRIEAT